MHHCYPDEEQVRKGSSGCLLAALRRAVLAGWAAGAGAVLLDVKPRHNAHRAKLPQRAPS